MTTFLNGNDPFASNYSPPLPPQPNTAGAGETDPYMQLLQQAMGMGASSAIPGLGIALTGAGLLGGLLNPPEDQSMEYKRSAGLEQAFQELMSLPGFQESLSVLNRGTTAAIGQTRREGGRDIRGTLADPGQVARFTSELYATTAAQGTQQRAQNYQTAFQGGLGKGGTLGQLSLSEQEQQQQIAQWNAGQKGQQQQYWGGLFGGLGELGASFLMG